MADTIIVKPRNPIFHTRDIQELDSRNLIVERTRTSVAIDTEKWLYSPYTAPRHPAWSDHKKYLQDYTFISKLPSPHRVPLDLESVDSLEYIGVQRKQAEDIYFNKYVSNIIPDEKHQLFQCAMTSIERAALISAPECKSWKEVFNYSGVSICPEVENVLEVTQRIFESQTPETLKRVQKFCARDDVFEYVEALEGLFAERWNQMVAFQVSSRRRGEELEVEEKNDESILAGWETTSDDSLLTVASEDRVWPAISEGFTEPPSSPTPAVDRNLDHCADQFDASKINDLYNADDSSDSDSNGDELDDDLDAEDLDEDDNFTVVSDTSYQIFGITLESEDTESHYSLSSVTPTSS